MKKLTELVMILDRSGSMGGLERDTINGYNRMLEKQRAVDGRVLVSTVLFDEHVEMLYDRVPLEELPQMTDKTYFVRGCTALLDAVGGAIHHIENRQMRETDEERPEKTILVITTDGLENASKEYTFERVKKMVERKKEMDGWEFLFLGANIDAVETAGRFGIFADRAATYNSDHEGTALNYDVLSDAVRDMRVCKTSISAEWKKRIDEDFEKRGGKTRGRA